MLTEREQFKLGFLKTCAQRGLSLEETHEAVKRALAEPQEKQASLGGALTSILQPVGNLATWGGKTLGTGLLLAPVGIGAMGGYLAGRGRGGLTDEDINEAKKHELIAAYHRAAEDIRRRHEVAQKKKTRRSAPVRALV